MFFAKHLPGFGGAAVNSVIKSIQQVSVTIGNAATSNTATITSVTTSNCIVLFEGATYTGTGGTTDVPSASCYVELTNSTTVTATRKGSSNSITAYCTVIEFVSGFLTSNQAGTISYTGTSSTATITSVDTTKAVCFYLGSSANGSGGDQYLNSVELTNATTVTARNGSGGGVAKTLSYQVVEISALYLNSVQKLAISAGANTQLDTTITSVNTANSFISYQGINTARSSFDNSFYNVKLTSATNVQINNGGNSANVNNATLYCTVVELKTGVISSIQRNTSDITTSSATTDATITSVNTAKTVSNRLGIYETTATPTDFSTFISATKIQSSTAHRSFVNTQPTTGTQNVSWEAIQFY